MNNRTILHFSSRLWPNDFAVYEITKSWNAISSASQKGFYNICLLTSPGIDLHLGTAKKFNGAALLFVKPYSSPSWNLTPIAQEGYACIFKENFLKARRWPAHIQHSLLPNVESSSIYLLNCEQKDFITFLFTRMLMEQDTAYFFKNDLMHNYAYLIIHEALKMQTSLRLN